MSEIFFESLDAWTTDGFGGAPMMFLGSTGLASALTVGDGMGTATLFLLQQSIGYTYDSDLDDPPIPATANTVLTLTAVGEGYLRLDGSGANGMKLAGSGAGGNAWDGAGQSPMFLGSFGLDLPADQLPYFFLVEQAPITFGTAGAWFEDVDEALSLVETLDPTLILLIEAMLRMEALPYPFAVFTQTVEDSLVVQDAVILILQREVLANVSLIDEVTFNFRQIVTVVDQLMMQDESLGLINALISVVVALELRDVVIPVWQAEVPDSLVLTEQQTFRVNVAVQVLADLILAETVDEFAVMFAVVDDHFELADDWDTNLAMIAEIMDNVDFGIRIRVGDDIYAGYVVNIRNAAVSEYDNYPFNSFALIGGRPFGAAADGIYLLQGDDDAGTPIDAFVRTGILNMGSLTKVPNGWIGVKGDGSIILKTITMDAGVKKENHYKMKLRPQGEPVESRFDVAKGLTSTYWQWELENVDGAYFELDVVKVWPIRMSRRYSGR